MFDLEGQDERALSPTERKLAASAAVRVKARRAVVPPLLRTEPDEQEGWFAAPVSQDDWEPWACLLLDAFGTRSVNVANAFMSNLRAMCPQLLDGKPNEKDPHAFEQAVAIVASLRPSNEAEAAMAAQMVAVHFATMKVAARIGHYDDCDHRMAASLAGLGKAYSQQMAAMKARKSRPSKRQTIAVTKTVNLTYSDNRQVTLPDGGAPISASPIHEPIELRAGARAPAIPVGCPSLPGEDNGGECMPSASHEGQAGLSLSRGQSGSAARAGQRELEARRLHGGSDQPAAGGRGIAEGNTGGAGQ